MGVHWGCNWGPLPPDFSFWAWAWSIKHRIPLSWLRLTQVALVWGLVASIASWQLSASLLMLQLAAMLVLYSLSPQYLPLHKYRTLAWTHVIGVGLASVFLFGNLMTACSLYTCMALSTLAMTYVPQPQEQPKHFVWRALRLLVLVGGVLVASVLLRMFLVFVFQVRISHGGQATGGGRLFGVAFSESVLQRGLN